MAYTYEMVTNDHRGDIVRIFNYYVREGFAAFPIEPVGPEFYERFKALTRGYPFIVVKCDETVVGFACLRPYHHAESFAHTAEITYFILPEHTGQGIASEILVRFKKAARMRGISTLLASISSLNEGSIRFHEKHGFVECGHLRNIGEKFGQKFGVIWMQLDL